jgi:predicted PurR-regulated permease PerM
MPRNATKPTETRTLSTSTKPAAAARFNLNPALGLLVGIATLYFGRGVLIPVALSLLFSFLLVPPMVRLQRWHLGKTFSALVVAALSFSVLFFTGWLVLGQTLNLASELPQYRENVRTKLRVLNSASLNRLGQARQLLGEVTQDLKQDEHNQPPSADALKHHNTPSQPIAVQVREPEPTLFQLLESVAGSAFEPLATALIVLIFTTFMLLGREDLRDRLLRLAGSSRMHTTTQALDDATRRVSRYLRMQFAVNALYGACVGIGLLLIGIPHPLVWALLATLLRFIPYVGPWIAAAAPLLLSIAVAPGWTKFAWTLGLYIVLEFVAGNVVEPLLYGASTGISAMAILVAAVFWTWLWGPIGLLLSTPLTVCFVVIGRYVPHLEFLGILFGDEPVLSPAQRFYQRMIAMDAEEAADLTEQLLKDQSLAETYDAVVIPALSMAEEGRHAGFLDASVEEYFYESTRDLVEDLGSQHQTAAESQAVPSRIVCLPAKDEADEISARMLIQLLPANVSADVLPFDMPMEKVLQFVASQKIDVICVSGIPPQTTRQVALRCKQLRRRFPQLTIIAAVWSTADLASIRGRIPVTDATHVACTLKQALDYLGPNTAALLSEPEYSGPTETPGNSIAESDLSERPGTPLQDVLDRITREAARVFDAPIAILNLVDEKGQYWSSECGMPVDMSSMSCDPRMRPSDCVPTPHDIVVIEDVLADDCMAKNPFLIEKGIRFYADAPLVNRSGKTIGSLRVFDTRPRSVDEQAKENLGVAVAAVLEALEIRSIPLPSAENLQAMPAAQNSP